MCVWGGSGCRLSRAAIDSEARAAGKRLAIRGDTRIGDSDGLLGLATRIGVKVTTTAGGAHRPGTPARYQATEQRASVCRRTGKTSICLGDKDAPAESSVCRRTGKVKIG